MTPTEKYLPTLIEGDTDATVALFDGRPVVNDALSGPIGNYFTFWAAARHMWLADRQAALEEVAVTRAAGRTVVEVVLRLVQEGRPIELPVAIVGEEAGSHLRAVRVYHSTFPLSGRHAVRGRIFPDVSDVRAPDVVGAYQEALARGDVEGILATLDEDAVVREPSGGAHTHRGGEAVRRFYEAILAGGGIPLLHHTVTDDGTACAIEYTVTRWGGGALPAQAGVAVYVRGGAGGRLVAARIYDDVEPPR